MVDMRLVAGPVPGVRPRAGTEPAGEAEERQKRRLATLRRTVTMTKTWVGEHRSRQPSDAQRNPAKQTDLPCSLQRMERLNLEGLGINDEALPRHATQREGNAKRVLHRCHEDENRRRMRRNR